MWFIVKNLMLFLCFLEPNAKLAPKVSMNDRFYKVFCITFLQAPKHCFTNGFLVFGYVVKGYQIIVKNLMLF